MVCLNWTISNYIAEPFIQDLLLVESPTCLSKSNTSKSVFNIPIEVPYKNAKRDVSGITSASLFAHFLCQIAEKMDAGPSQMAAIGYIPSFIPKSHKPILHIIHILYVHKSLFLFASNQRAIAE